MNIALKSCVLSFLLIAYSSGGDLISNIYSTINFAVKTEPTGILFTNIIVRVLIH